MNAGAAPGDDTPIGQDLPVENGTAAPGRLVAFAPIGAAVLGLALIAVVSALRPDTATASVDSIDAIITGSVAAD